MLNSVCRLSSGFARLLSGNRGFSRATHVLAGPYDTEEMALEAGKLYLRKLEWQE